MVAPLIHRPRPRPGLWMLGAALLLAACGSHPRAPVEERSAWRPTAVSRPAEYRVVAGDTLYGIAFRYGLDWRDLAQRNSLNAPYTIVPGQVLRLEPRPVTARRWQSTAPSTGSGSTRPAAKSTPPAASKPPPPADRRSTTTRPAGQSNPPPKPTASASPHAWQWPAKGRLLSTFRSGDQSRLGLDIAGRAGEPVKAAAAGEVVYSGSGLIGYGELIIIKHDDRLLSAYGHNRKRLVQEGQRVSAGQTISELGQTPDGEAVLHFEIRLDGVPQDPERYLPPR